MGGIALTIGLVLGGEDLGSVAPAGPSELLLETGFMTLLESGDKILLEI